MYACLNSPAIRTPLSPRRRPPSPLLCYGNVVARFYINAVVERFGPTGCGLATGRDGCMVTRTRLYFPFTLLSTYGWALLNFEDSSFARSTDVLLLSSGNLPAPLPPPHPTLTLTNTNTNNPSPARLCH